MSSQKTPLRASALAASTGANKSIAVAAEDEKQLVIKALKEAYLVAESAHKHGDFSAQQAVLGEADFVEILRLARIQHAARGIALTLAAFKTINPSQDIRNHKSEHVGGFSGRTIDASCTVPFLRENSLYYNVETHWLSQTFSFAGPYSAESILRTTPRAAGPTMLNVVNSIEKASDPVSYARAVVHVILAELIEERNKGKVLLEKPQNLSIEEALGLINAHFHHGYAKNSPRLPQVAIYAIYQCIVETVGRYKDLKLMPLERMKAANRKSGSVGDVDVNKADQPFEAVEIKFGERINRDHVAEAIQKIKTASVQRYLLLSTSGVADDERDSIRELQTSFRRSNGCEIIVDGVLDTLRYYLRLIDSPATFLNRYTSIVEADDDLGYEHRLGWNEVCAKRNG